MNNFVKIHEGKSKIVYAEKGIDDYVFLEFKGDVRSTKWPIVYDKKIADLRALTSHRLFCHLRKAIPCIAQTEMVDSHIIKIEKCEPLPLEWIPRYVAAGSVVARFGFTRGHRFKNPVLKIDYKAHDDDHLINDDLIIEMGLFDRQELEQAKILSIKIANELKEVFALKGLDLWDFKIELGRLPNGGIMLIDEISFDGMRLKDAITGESFDKDIYRETGSL